MTLKTAVRKTMFYVSVTIISLSHVPEVVHISLSA